MKTIPLFETLIRSLKATAFFAVLLCGVYPIIVYGVSRAVLPDRAEGSLVTRSGKVAASELIGQDFSAPDTFHPRPSATTDGPYNASASGGSNLGPLSQKLTDAVRERVAAYRVENQLDPGTTVPADAVTASASGLDPDISPANARLQATRVAHARAIPVEKVLELIDHMTEGPTFGFLGQPRVNVLRINLALDALGGKNDGR